MSATIYQQRGKHGKKAVIGQLSGEAETVVVDGLFDCSFEENSPAYGAAERDAHGRGAALWLLLPLGRVLEECQPGKRSAKWVVPQP